MIAQSVIAVKPCGASDARVAVLAGSGIDRNAGAAEFSGVKSVTGSLLNLDVAGDDGDGRHRHVWRPQTHDKSDGVIGCNIGIDEKCARHRGSITNRIGISIPTAYRMWLPDLLPVAGGLDFKIHRRLDS